MKQREGLINRNDKVQCPEPCYLQLMLFKAKSFKVVTSLPLQIHTNYRDSHANTGSVCQNQEKERNNKCVQYKWLTLHGRSQCNKTTRTAIFWPAIVTFSPSPICAPKISASPLRSCSHKDNTAQDNIQLNGCYFVTTPLQSCHTRARHITSKSRYHRPVGIRANIGW